MSKNSANRTSVYISFSGWNNSFTKEWDIWDWLLEKSHKEHRELKQQIMYILHQAMDDDMKERNEK